MDLSTPPAAAVDMTNSYSKSRTPILYAYEGWRKLLRHPKALSYRIHTLPPVPEVLQFIQAQARQDHAEAYGTLNMGAGFALFVPATQAEQAVAVARGCGVPAWLAGEVQTGPKHLLIEPLEVNFSGGDLQLR